MSIVRGGERCAGGEFEENLRPRLDFAEALCYNISR